MISPGTFKHQFSDRKVFFGGLAWSTTESTLQEYLESKCDVVVEKVIIMRDRGTGNSRGFGFVILQDRESVDRVCSVTHSLDGKKIEAKRAIPKDEIIESNTRKLFVGGIPVNLSDEEFRDHFEEFGIVTEIQIVKDRSTNKSRGFGFVTYEDKDSVENVLAVQHTLLGKTVEVKKAEPKKSTNDTLVAPSQFMYPGKKEETEVHDEYRQDWDLITQIFAPNIQIEEEKEYIDENGINLSPNTLGNRSNQSLSPNQNTSQYRSLSPRSLSPRSLSPRSLTPNNNRSYSKEYDNRSLSPRSYNNEYENMSQNRSYMQEYENSIPYNKRSISPNPPRSRQDQYYQNTLNSMNGQSMPNYENESRRRSKSLESRIVGDNRPKMSSRSNPNFMKKGEDENQPYYKKKESPPPDFSLFPIEEEPNDKKIQNKIQGYNDYIDMNEDYKLNEMNSLNQNGVYMNEEFNMNGMDHFSQDPEINIDVNNYNHNGMFLDGMNHNYQMYNYQNELYMGGMNYNYNQNGMNNYSQNGVNMEEMNYNQNGMNNYGQNGMGMEEMNYNQNGMNNYGQNGMNMKYYQNGNNRYGMNGNRSLYNKEHKFNRLNGDEENHQNPQDYGNIFMNKNDQGYFSKQSKRKSWS
jgi:RNA recognition motif-containing protein